MCSEDCFSVLGAGPHVVHMDTGTWGKPGDELSEAPVQAQDPNYDGSVVVDKRVRLQETIFIPTPEDVAELLSSVVKEYFDNGDVGEVEPVCKTIEAASRAAGADILAYIVRVGLENNGRERELASTLVSGLCGRKVLDERDMLNGCQMLLDQLDDVKLDAPDAAEALGIFIARFVADDCLPPVFVTAHPASQSGAFPNPSVRIAMKTARGLIRYGTA